MLRSIRLPLSALPWILGPVLSLVVGFWYLKSVMARPVDVSWLYYPGAATVYLLWVGSILFFMVNALRRAKHVPVSDPQTRFLCLIPAHNEENVIQNPILSLRRQDYPRHLFDVVVICDGTDSTEAVAEELGATVLPTPAPGSGKHRGLALAITEYVTADDDRYVVVFDAAVGIPDLVRHFRC